MKNQQIVVIAAEFNNSSQSTGRQIYIPFKVKKIIIAQAQFHDDSAAASLKIIRSNLISGKQDLCTVTPNYDTPLNIELLPSSELIQNNYYFNIENLDGSISINTTGFFSITLNFIGYD